MVCIAQETLHGMLAVWHTAGLELLLVLYFLRGCINTPQQNLGSLLCGQTGIPDNKPLSVYARV